MVLHAIPEGLEYIERIQYKPEDFNSLNVIHITGTKGKGSTAAFCNSLLCTFAQHQPSPPKIGLFTSPHITSVRERIRINGVPISTDMFSFYFWQVYDRFAGSKPPSNPDTPFYPVYFKFLTYLALHVFISEKVDATIMEVGVGGRYDSTNIVPKPTITVITSLGIDHVKTLGGTIAEIASHKAGIFKVRIILTTGWSACNYSSATIGRNDGDRKRS